MIRSAITVSLVAQAKGGPFVYWDGLEAAAASAAKLGFDAIEIFAPSAASIDRPALRALLKQHGLAAAAFGTGGGWLVHQWHLTHADPAIRAQAREFIRAIIDVGGEFKAPAIIGSMQGKAEGAVTRDQALTWLAEALADLGAHAARHGVPLLYEPLNRYETNLLNRQLDAARFLEERSIANVKLLCDLFHMNIEEVSPAETLRACGRHVGHVHFADSNRRAIGFGHTETGSVIAALQAIGFDGYLSGEILPLPDSEAAAAQTIKAIRTHLPAKTMLKHQLIHPKISEVLARAGHHSVILIADGNYPVWGKKGPNAELVSLNLSPGIPTVAQVLRAVLSAVPVDAVNTMGIPPDDSYARQGEPPVWAEFRQEVKAAGLKLELQPILKWDFYKAVESADHILTIQTGDQALWGNVLLTVGCRTA